MVRRKRYVRRIAAGLVITLVCAIGLYHGCAIAQKAEAPADWVADIEKIFIRSEDCKQCHDRHYEEWKGAREQTPDLKTFGRVDAALLHGTSLESPVFRTVLGVWLQTNPTATNAAAVSPVMCRRLLCFPNMPIRLWPRCCPANHKWRASAAPPAI